MKDFTKEDLSENRIENIILIFKEKKGKLFILSLLTIPFFVPMIIFMFFMKKAYLESSVDLKTFFLSYSIPLIVLSFIGGVGLSGIFYSIRRLLYLETVRLPYYFLKGIKESGIEIGAFTTIYVFICTLLDLVSRIFISNTNVYIAIYIITRILMIIILYIFIFMFSSITVYNNSFILVIKDGFKYSLMNKNKFMVEYLILIFSISLRDPFLSLISFMLFLIILPLIITTYLGHACYMFDININKTDYVDFYKKGIK